MSLLISQAHAQAAGGSPQGPGLMNFLILPLMLVVIVVVVMVLVIMIVVVEKVMIVEGE